MNPYLPQNDPNLMGRKKDLAETAARYKWSDTLVPGLAMLEEVPFSQVFSGEYLAERSASAARLVSNLALIKVRRLFDPLDSLQDFEDMYPTLSPKPSSIRDFQTDGFFAEQRLCGANPLSIRRVAPGGALPAHSAIADAHIAESLGPAETLSNLIASGDLYFVDHVDVWQKQHSGSFQGKRKYGPEALGLFLWRKVGLADRGSLMPVAIQLSGVNGTPVVVTPKSKVKGQWRLAKTCFQIADANVHEMVMHLGRTHFAMEPFAVATSRQLADAHPLKMLLKPHLRFMLFNNSLGIKKLINQGGPVDELLAGSLKESIAMAVRAVQSFDVSRAAFPTEIASRGMDDVVNLPHYPYRDDGMLLWNAIKDYVAAYLSLYYKTPADMANDYELQAWADDLVKNGKVQGMAPTVVAMGALTDIVTTVIFTCSAVHSAVNYPQWDYMGFVPNMPLAGYTDYRELLPQPFDDDAYMKFLPPNQPAIQQLAVTYFLAGYRFDRLGYYGSAFADPLAQGANESFRRRLDDIDRTIDYNNTKRRVAYPYLKPSLVLNSISI